MGTKPTYEQFQRQLEHLADVLRSEITDGTYAEGDFLPSEMLLASRFGMGNNSIRKGLEQLVQEGLIEKIPRVGNRVKALRRQVELTFACNGTSERDMEIAGLLQGFERKYPWIRVRATFPSSVDVYSHYDGEEAADLVMLNGFQFGRAVEQGDLDKLEELPAHPDTYPMLTRMFSVRDRLYVQPIVFSPIVLCYNKAHFAEKGLPEPDGSWTWADLIRAAVQLSREPGRYGFCFHLPSENRWPLFVLQGGETMARGSVRPDDERFSRLLAGIRVCRELVGNRSMFPFYLSEDNAEHNRKFMEGKLSMLLTSYLGMNEWKHASLPYDVSPVPFLYEPRTLSIAIGAAVSKRSRFKEEALLLVSYMASPEAQQYIARHTLSIPSWQRSLRDPLQTYGMNVPSRYALYREMMFSMRSHSELGLPVKAYTPVFRLLKEYWAGLMEEDELVGKLRGLLSAGE